METTVLISHGLPTANRVHRVPRNLFSEAGDLAEQTGQSYVLSDR